MIIRVIKTMTKEVVFEGTNEDYLNYCKYSEMESEYESLEEDYYYNCFAFGDSGEFEIEYPDLF